MTKYDIDMEHYYIIKYKATYPGNFTKILFY